MRILLATPTRGRPASFKQMVRSARRTANDNAQLAIVAMVDHDDYTRKDYAIERGYTLMQGHRARLPVLWNQIVEANRFDIVMMCADDLRFRTTGWDTEVRAAFSQWDDGIGLVYCDDGIHGEGLATHSFVSQAWTSVVGYLPESLDGDFVDNYLHSLGLSIGRVTYLPRVLIEHLHPLVGKAPMDSTYSYRLTPEGQKRALDAWHELLGTSAPVEAVVKLRRAISES